jgi:hypothetical protein
MLPCSVVYLVVSSPPATEEIGVVGREIESRQDCFPDQTIDIYGSNRMPTVADERRVVRVVRVVEAVIRGHAVVRQKAVGMVLGFIL